MKIALEDDIKSDTFSRTKIYTRLKEKETNLFDFKFYQKLFVLLILMSTILIFPESPRELENICESFNSKESCNVW